MQSLRTRQELALRASRIGHSAAPQLEGHERAYEAGETSAPGVEADASAGKWKVGGTAGVRGVRPDQHWRYNMEEADVEAEERKRSLRKLAKSGCAHYYVVVFSASAPCASDAMKDDDTARQQLAKTRCDHGTR